jgi:hypothetical protein
VDYNDFTFVPGVGGLSHRQFDQWSSGSFRTADPDPLLHPWGTPLRCMRDVGQGACPGPAARIRTARGTVVYLCRSHLDAWLDDADDRPWQEPIRLNWL